jgi:murein L,D-transpeptidase YcbB/YkuD
MEGEDVERWQRRMSRRGWDIPTGGRYNEETEEVCKKFQRDKGLDVNGVVDRETWRAAWLEPIT